MDKLMPTWKLFEELVRKILQAQNFVVSEHFPRGDAGYDFDGKLGIDAWAIEVKYYRTERAQPTLIEKAATRLVINGISARAKKGMLIVSCILPPELKSTFENQYSVTFIDRTDLRSMASVDATLAEELEALLEADPELAQPSGARHFDPLSSKPIDASSFRRKDTRGTELCQELKGLKRGKASWAEYERICAEILKYLFPNDLHGWHKQKRTDDGLNRYDFVCRIRPTREFWKFLIDHLNSRYVLFEFKNYSSKIKQGQILTTEKYLLERGLRRVAIVMTRLGAEQHAIAMTQGAMREHGKLMLVIDDEQVCQMLHMKERGDDPTDFLFDLADNFLLSLPR